VIDLHIFETVDGQERRFALITRCSYVAGSFRDPGGRTFTFGYEDMLFLKTALHHLPQPQDIAPLAVPPFDLDDESDQRSKTKEDKAHAATPQATPVGESGAAPASGPPLPPKAGKRWTDDEDRQLAGLYRSGKDPAAIAAELGRSDTAIIGRLLLRGLAELRPVQAAGGQTHDP
jgi:hypothetical protein